MTTFTNNQVITGIEANAIVEKHGFSLATLDGSIVTLADTDNGSFFTDNESVVIMAANGGCQLRIKEERFTVHLNETVKATCGEVWENNWSCNADPEWTIEA